MFKAIIAVGDYTFEGTVYQIFPIECGILYAVYRLDWEDEWRVAPLENVTPIEEDGE